MQPSLLAEIRKKHQRHLKLVYNRDRYGLFEARKDATETTCRKGGLIAFHAMARGPPNIVGGVPRFWGEIKSGYRYKEFIENSRQGWGGIGLFFIE